MAKKRRRPSNRSFLIAVLVGFAFIITGIILLMQEIPQPGLPTLVFGMIVAGVAASWWDRLSREESAAREAAEAEAADAPADEEDAPIVADQGEVEAEATDAPATGEPAAETDA